MTISITTNVYGKVAPKESDNRNTLKVNNITGIGYSTEKNPKSGYYKSLTGVELLKKNLSQLLRTEKGERFMLPNYGCNLKQYAMEPMDEALFNEVKIQIQDCISKYLRNITLNRLQVFEADASVMNVKLFCSLKNEEAVRFDTTLNL
jgi:phage baseplate assembly protein W